MTAGGGGATVSICVLALRALSSEEAAAGLAFCTVSSMMSTHINALICAKPV